MAVPFQAFVDKALPSHPVVVSEKYVGHAVTPQDDMVETTGDEESALSGQGVLLR